MAKKSLLERAANKLRRVSERNQKALAQLARPRAAATNALFVVGCQRSGTNMLLDVLDKSPETWTYEEDDPKAFIEYRIKPLDVRNQLIASARCRWVAFKPICDSQHTDHLLAVHQGSRAVWIFRHYQDVANSTFAKWPKTQLNHLRRIATDDAQPHWVTERVSAANRALVKELFSEDMPLIEAAALKWYLRNSFYFDLELHERPEDVLLVQYENLVTTPRHSFGQVFDFLGLEYRPEYSAGVFQSSVRKQDFPDINPRVLELCEDMMTRLQSAPAPQPEPAWP